MLLASPSACFKLFQEKRKRGHGRALLFEGVVGGYQCRAPHHSFPSPHTESRVHRGLRWGVANFKAGLCPRNSGTFTPPLYALLQRPPLPMAGAELAGNTGVETG